MPISSFKEVMKMGAIDKKLTISFFEDAVKVKPQTLNFLIAEVEPGLKIRTKFGNSKMFFAISENTVKGEVLYNSPYYCAILAVENKHHYDAYWMLINASAVVLSSAPGQRFLTPVGANPDVIWDFELNSPDELRAHLERKFQFADHTKFETQYAHLLRLNLAPEFEESKLWI